MLLLCRSTSPILSASGPASGVEGASAPMRLPGLGLREGWGVDIMQSKGASFQQPQGKQE